MFSSLKVFPNIPKMNLSNVTNISYIFSDCRQLPDISKIDTSKVIDMSYLFFNCEDFSLPDISNWNVSKVKK